MLRAASEQWLDTGTHLVMPINVVIAVSYTGRTSSGVGFASVAADNGISISFRHGSRSWSARTGKENCCDMLAGSLEALLQTTLPSILHTAYANTKLSTTPAKSAGRCVQDRALCSRPVTPFPFERPEACRKAVCCQTSVQNTASALQICAAPKLMTECHVDSFR